MKSMHCRQTTGLLHWNKVSTDKRWELSFLPSLSLTYLITNRIPNSTVVNPGITLERIMVAGEEKVTANVHSQVNPTRYANQKPDQHFSIRKHS
jgi:hypothetical protein